MNKETFIERLFLSAAVISASVTILIFGFMVMLALPLFEEGLFFEVLTRPWLPDKGIFGIYPMIVGTVLIASLSLIFSFPFSLGVSALISTIAPKRIGRFLKMSVQMMTGIPTVIYGFVGIFLLVPIIRKWFGDGSGMCILSAALMLSVLIAPTMILFFTDSFANVPKSHTDAIEALGGTPAQKFLYVILPQSWRGVLTGAILALGRAVGDTLIALMIAGNAVAPPMSLLDSARTLTSHIALIIAADIDSLEFKTIFACGILLYLLTTVAVISVRKLTARADD
jgi:phosphate transport system permease protein